MQNTVQTALLVVIIGLLIKNYLPQRAAPAAKKSRKLVLDSCALIDGRIIDLAQSGFVHDELIVPEFVLHELQMLADGGDAHKRERARYGLDVVQQLQDNKICTVTIDHSISRAGLTDDKLVELALAKSADLYTTDYNLQKLAEIKDVRVLNVNDLAQKLRPTALPGEKKRIKIVQKGSNPKQGVGYLDDGTMIVVDNAVRLISRMVEVEVTRVHQTVAGKMIFADLIGEQRAAVQSHIADRIRKKKPALRS